MSAAAAIDRAGAGARRRPSRVAVFSVLTITLLTVALLAIGIGAVSSPPGSTVSIFLHSLGLPAPWTFTDRQQAVVLSVRFPRVLLGALVGAGLGMAGAAMQGLFRNPLADPSLVGVSAGAALAAVSVIVLGAPLAAMLPPGAGIILQPAAAFCGALLVTWLVYRFAGGGGRPESVATMLLAGIGINAVAAAGAGLLTSAANDAQLRSITFWSLGSLGGATWPSLAAAAPFLVAPLVLLPRYAGRLNALVLGESEAAYLGVDVRRLERALVILSALSVGAGVALAGVIGFVAIVTPHVLRLVLGSDNRLVLPGAGLLGATLLVAADLVSRTLVSPAELPIGAVTALAGGPFFLWLLSRGPGGRERVC